MEILTGVALDVVDQPCRALDGGEARVGLEGCVPVVAPLGQMGGHILGGGQLVVQILDLGIVGGNNLVVLEYVGFLDLIDHGLPITGHGVIPRQAGLLGVFLARLEEGVPSGIIARRANSATDSRSDGKPAFSSRSARYADAFRADVGTRTDQLAVDGSAFGFPRHPVVVFGVGAQINELVGHGEQ